MVSNLHEPQPDIILRAGFPSALSHGIILMDEYFCRDRD
jgi:hypothetical protein